MRDLKNPKTYDNLKLWIQRTDQGEDILAVVGPDSIYALPIGLSDYQKNEMEFREFMKVGA